MYRAKVSFISTTAKVSFALAIFLYPLPSFAKEPLPILRNLSTCGANASLMNLYHKQANQIAEAHEMEHAAIAYAKTTLDIGIDEGLTREEVIAMNKASIKNVSKEFQEDGAKFLKDIGIKNNTCFELLKAKPNVAEIFGKRYRETN